VLSLGIFFRGTPDRTMCPEVDSVSTKDSSWGKGGRCVWLTTYHPCSAETRKSGALSYLGLSRETFTFYPYSVDDRVNVCGAMVE